MTISAAAILSAAQDHARASGLFASVQGHEPKNAPPEGLSAALWVDYIGPDPRLSGLAVTSGVLRLKIRIATHMLSDPQDEIDLAMIGAVDYLLSAYSGDFTLNGLVNHVDLLGRTGIPLSAEAGYLSQDGRLYRVMVITLPLVVDDIWSQAP